MQAHQVPPNPPASSIVKGVVHCPICTHSVPADVQYVGKRAKVVPGQKCSRCHSALDAAALLYLQLAA